MEQTRAARAILAAAYLTAFISALRAGESFAEREGLQPRGCVHNPRVPLIHWHRLRRTTSRMAAVVELDRISKSYENKIAVKDLSLRIDSGTMFGLLGPNGAGKTSSIRMIVGITMPDSGTVSLLGKPFTRA